MPTPISARTPLPTASALDRVRPLTRDVMVAYHARAGDRGGVLGAIGDGGHWREGHVVMYNVLVSL
ncbi:hypothetical protein MLGJGCBP_00330 [Rhodococcus sp. T7]|nr:hypothetical protein MLGJGCBP_00330 [Rhodococcus sp. T7]